MKYRMIMTAALVIAISLATGGCFGNVWRVSFLSEDNYADWDRQDYGGTEVHVPALGVKLDSWALNSPVGFDEDFTITIWLTLDVEETKTAFFGILVGGSPWFYPTNYVYSCFADIGKEGYEDWWIDDNGTGLDMKISEHIDETLPTLIRKGPNYWKLVKNGNRIQTYINLYRISDFTLSGCQATEFFINLYSELSGGSVIFNSIKVEYKGSIVTL